MDQPPGSGGVVEESRPQHENIKVKSHLYCVEPIQKILILKYFDFCARVAKVFWDSAHFVNFAFEFSQM